MKVYDFIEFVAVSTKNQNYAEQSNSILEREFSAYRFLDFHLAPITSEHEIRAVDDAVKLGGPFSPAALHLGRALELLSDRTNPDYRNSIKESISAVEAMCSLIAGQNKASLAEALRTIDQQNPLHKSLRGAFQSTIWLHQ